MVLMRVGLHRLTEMGFEKLVNELDAKEAARLGLVTRPLTEAVVQKQLEDLGLEAAFGTHSQIRGLSGMFHTCPWMVGLVPTHAYACIIYSPHASIYASRVASACDDSVGM